MAEDQKVVLVTGASSGIGKQTALLLAKKGWKVFGTSRSKKKSMSLDDASVSMLVMDVDDDGSVAKAVTEVVSECGRIDAVVNNAGFGIAGSIEETSSESAHSQLETNFFGMHRVIREVAKIMRTQGSGSIINVSSIGGVVGLPYQGFYSASKFAVEGYSEALRMELKQFGISVVLIEPGDIATEFTARRKNQISSSSPYKESFNRVMAIVEHDETSGSSGDLVAKTIIKSLEKKNPKMRYRVGAFSQKFVCTLKRFLPARSMEWILSKYYKV